MATIAILDDEPALRHLFQRVLERAGHTVRTYGDGAAALEGLLDDPPAVFLTDLNVPSLTGVEVVARLRRDPRGRGIGCILLSGSTERELVRAAAVDFDAWLTKPVDIGDLVTAVADRLLPTEVRPTR
ncbi:MAG: response regulator [Candidatus Limnocylindria bacterium]